ncbi:hypothetical protein SAMN05216601_105240 [Ectopseudomonas composti]|uniref:Lipoprotein n=1 Tax=Ectopseudomonas composti TaxID=658457 RepID=A0A1I5MJ60_9GAMM|nr:hypothetical protein SAMN05216601_105240 [Pseudomonas composti]
MLKRSLLLCSFIAVGCSAQPKTAFIVHFENACAYPVEVSVHEYSNAKAPFVPGQRLDAGGSVEVLSHISFDESIDKSLPAGYRLDIAANGESIMLDRGGFLGQLAHSPVERKGRAINIWTIHDTALCP